jgi:acyl-coenzyme A thioesterase PaaI-like protein
MEEWISRLSIRSNFWHRIVVWIFLPLAYRSGIMLGRWNGDVYEARMPFRSFNKNWYGVMAGSALLANSEVAGGMCLFEAVGADYTLVCKEMRYKFRLPCRGPAIYRVRVNGNVEELRRTRLEFNVDVELEIVQAAGREGGKERCVGRCSATFHVAPKALFRARCAKEKESARTLANRGRQD